MQSSNSNLKGMAMHHPIHPHPIQVGTLPVLAPVRHWLDAVEIKNRRIAHLISRLIPAQCPFERDISFFGHVIAHIPPLCKLNPLYDQFIALRFRALCYLADVCDEDIQGYISNG